MGGQGVGLVAGRRQSSALSGAELRAASQIAGGAYLPVQHVPSLEQMSGRRLARCLQTGSRSGGEVAAAVAAAAAVVRRRFTDKSNLGSLSCCTLMLHLALQACHELPRMPKRLTAAMQYCPKQQTHRAAHLRPRQ